MTAERRRTKARQAPGSMPRRPLGSSDGPGAGDAIRAVEELVQGDVVHRAVENCFDLVQQPFVGNEASRTTRERLRREEGLRTVRVERATAQGSEVVASRPRRRLPRGWRRSGRQDGDVAKAISWNRLTRRAVASRSPAVARETSSASRSAPASWARARVMQERPVEDSGRYQEHPWRPTTDSSRAPALLRLRRP